MKRTWLLVTLVLTFAACTRSSETGGRTDQTPASTASDTVVVTGAVVTKDDKVPADGGVTLVVQSDDGATVTVEFESLFTLPSPAPERHALYQKLVPIQSGHRVRLVASRQGDILRLEDITKID